jgi:hypothetical protein
MLTYLCFYIYISVGVSDPRGSSTDQWICRCVSLPRWVDARWNTSGRDEAYIILHRGARSRGYKRCERARAREREGLALRWAVWVCLHRVSPTLSAAARLPPPAPPPSGRPWTSHFIDTRRCPAVQWRCSYALTWLAEECLEPCPRANVSHPVLEGKPNANHVCARISYSRTQQLHNMDIITQCSK